MKTLRALLYLSTLTLAHSQSTTITFDSGNLSPQTNPTCYGFSQQFSQTANYNWTLSCIDVNGNFTGVRSGAVPMIVGNGACPDLIPARCATPSGADAPTFTPARNLNSVTQTWTIAVNVVSAGLVSLTGLAQSCGPPVNTQSVTYTSNPSRCYCNPGDPSCKSTSPIVIDTIGEGFFLTDLAHGVQFRRGPASTPEQFSWTDPAHHNAWLVRPNQDGSVTSMSMNMFGNLSPQPQSSEPNGYAALAYWASQEGCGKVEKLDAQSCSAVWGALRLWQDANQDGVAQPEEIQSLSAGGVYAISLKYEESKYIDGFGNMFAFRSHIWDAADNENNRCYDVFLVHQ